MKDQIPHRYKQLIGKTIANIEYLSDAECNDLMWHNKPVAIVFTDGTFMIPVADDEGNDGGVLWYEGEGSTTILCSETVETMQEV